LLISRTLRLIIPIAGAVAGVVWSERELQGIQHEIELTKTLAEKLLPEDNDTYKSDINNGKGLTHAQGEGLRALRALLLKNDPARRFGGLRRVRTPSGDLLWICRRHHPEYDPGLPSLPK